MNFRTLTALAALGLSGSALADVVCDTCVYQQDAPATYLGELWPGDRGTFVSLNIAEQVGQAQPFQHIYVIDVATSYLELTVATVAGEGFAAEPWRVDFFYDGGNNGEYPTVCPDPTPGSACTSTWLTPDFDVAYWGDATIGKRFVAARKAFAPGRYLIRISASTREAGETSYKGQLTIRKQLR